MILLTVAGILKCLYFMEPDKTLEKGIRLLLEALYTIVDNAVGV